MGSVIDELVARMPIGGAGTDAGGEPEHGEAGEEARPAHDAAGGEHQRRQQQGAEMAFAEHDDAAGDHERPDQGEDRRQHAPLLGRGIGDAEPDGEHDGAQHDHGDRVHEQRQHAAADGNDPEPDQDVDRQRAGFAGGEAQRACHALPW